MFNFDFYNPTKIIFGRDRLNELDNLIDKSAKVMILYGGGSVKRFGTLDKVLNTLKPRKIIEFSGIEANPQYDTLMKAISIAKEEKVDFLLAIGGGSVMDGTKFVSLGAFYPGDPAELFINEPEANKKTTKAIPLGTVCTLPATGSEMNRGGVICYKDSKLSFHNDLAFPKFSFLDPTLTFTLPEKQIANGIVDTFIHVCEQYITYPNEGRFQDRTSEGILKTLIEIGKKTLVEKENYELRANLVWCATMGLNGLIGAGVPGDWSCHIIGHELTAKFRIDHARTLAIVQPSLWRIRKDKKKDKLVQFAERVWDITNGSDDEKIEKAIVKTEEFFNSLGISTKLRDYDVSKDSIPSVIEGLVEYGKTKLSETGDLTPDIALKILELSY